MKNKPFYEREGYNGAHVVLSLLPFLSTETDFIAGKERSYVSKLERDFQASLVKELKSRFPGAMVLKLDANYIQGIPDLLILWGEKWAALECKRSSSAGRQPNQEYYVKHMDDMSFSRFIDPDNKEEVLRELQQTFCA